MENCRSCGEPLLGRRFEQSDWCVECVTRTLDDQRREDTDKIKPEVFRT